jgi:hypothetical protein
MEPAPGASRPGRLRALHPGKAGRPQRPRPSLPAGAGAGSRVGAPGWAGQQAAGDLLLRGRQDPRPAPERSQPARAEDGRGRPLGHTGIPDP